MRYLLLLPSYKPLRKPVPIALGDGCPRKPTFVVESGSRKLPLPPNDFARKYAPSVEPRFLVMGVQKIRRPQMWNKFVVPTTAPTNLWQFGEWELILPLSSIHSPSFCEILGHMFQN